VILGSGEDDGGSIEFAAAPAEGMIITIVRSVVLNQLVRFIEGENFPAADYEYSLDHIVMALQELYQKNARCLQMPPSASDGLNATIGIMPAVTPGSVAVAL